MQKQTVTRRHLPYLVAGAAGAAVVIGFTGASAGASNTVVGTSRESCAAVVGAALPQGTQFIVTDPVVVNGKNTFKEEFDANGAPVVATVGSGGLVIPSGTKHYSATQAAGTLAIPKSITDAMAAPAPAACKNQ